MKTMITSSVKTALVLLLFIVSRTLPAQQNGIYNQTTFNYYLFNPAAAGMNKSTLLNMHYKKMWAGISESPEMISATADGSIKNDKIGLGMLVMSEETGITSKTLLSLSYRYKVKLNEHHQLYFGVGAGINRQQADFSKIIAADPGEFESLPGRQAYTIPDLNTGIIYTFKKLELHLAGAQLLSGNFKYKNSTYDQLLTMKAVPNYTFAAAFNFSFGEKIKYKPALFIRSTQGLPIQIDFNSTFMWNEKIIAGIGFRQSYNVYGNLGYSVSDRVRFIYTYEYGIGINNITKGSNEFGLMVNLSGIKQKTEIEKIKNKQVDEIYEKLDQTEQKIEKTEQRVDTLDKNFNLMKQEIEEIKQGEVDEEELKKIITEMKETSKTETNETDNSNIKTASPRKYKPIKISSESDADKITDTPGAGYTVILGVFRNFSYAKSYQKFLMREFNMTAKLIQLDGPGAGYYYVGLDQQYDKIKDASKKLFEVREYFSKQPIKVTNGQPWILQINK